MVKVSHARCRQCGQSRHRGARFNLCRNCWKVRKPQQRAGWQAIKNRRALKRLALAAVASVPNGVSHVPEEVHVTDPIETTDPRPVSRARVSLTPEQEQEIVVLYTTTDTPLSEISQTYGVSATYPYRILERAGVTWRRGDAEGFRPGPRPQARRELPAHIAAMQDVHVKDQIEQAIRELPVVPELEQIVTETLALERQTDLPAWHVEFSGSLDLQAKSFDAAVKLARELGAVEITLVRRLP